MKQELVLIICNKAIIIASYPLFLVLGIGIAMILFTCSVRRITRISLAKIVPLLVLLVFAVPLGARLLNIWLNWDYYLMHSSKIWAMKAAGFSLYGGLLAGAVTAVIYLRKNKADVWASADAAALAIGPGIAVMRAGCYLNGCCFGKETSLPWGVSYPAGTDAYLYQLLGSGWGNISQETILHPTQIYEMAAAIFCTGIAFVLIGKKAPPGIPFLAFVLLFTIFRFFNLSLRVLPAGLGHVPYFYPLLYGSIILWAIIMLVIRRKS